MSKSRNTAKKHKEKLRRLQGKDLEFYKYLQEHDEKLLQFEDEDIDDDINIENEYPMSGEDELGDEIRKKPIKKKKEEPAQNVITANSGRTRNFHSPVVHNVTRPNSSCTGTRDSGAGSWEGN